MTTARETGGLETTVRELGGLQTTARQPGTLVTTASPEAWRLYSQRARGPADYSQTARDPGDYSEPANLETLQSESSGACRLQPQLGAYGLLRGKSRGKRKPLFLKSCEISRGIRFNFEGDPRENQGKFKGKSKGTVKGRFDSHGKLKGNQKKHQRETMGKPGKLKGELAGISPAKIRGRKVSREKYSRGMLLLTLVPGPPAFFLQAL